MSNWGASTRTVRARLASGAAAAALVLVATGCGGGTASQPSGERAQADDASATTIVTLHGPCTIQTDQTCQDVAADAGSYAQVNLGDMTMVNASFRSTDLGNANFANSKVEFADFSGANLVNADFTNATLTGSSFAGAKLGGAKFFGADLTGASFANANLDNADLSGVTMDQTNCPQTPAGGVCVKPGTEQTAAHVGNNDANLAYSLDMVGDSAGKLQSATFTYQALTSAGTSPTGLQIWAYVTGSPGLAASNVPLPDPPAAGAPAKTWDITNNLLQQWGTGTLPPPTSISIGWRDANNQVPASMDHGNPPFAFGQYQQVVSGLASKFSASASEQDGQDATLAFDFEGDSNGTMTSATVTVTTQSFAGVVGKLSLTVAQPGGAAPVTQDILLSDSPGPGDPAKTWDVTADVIAKLGTATFPATTSFSAQFFADPSGGGAVGNPLTDSWMPGSAGGFVTDDSARGSDGSGSIEMIITSPDSTAKVTSAKLVINAKGVLANTKSVGFSFAVPAGDAKIPDSVVPVAVAAGSQTLDVTAGLVGAMGTAVIPPRSIITATAYADTHGQAATSKQLSGPWSSGQLPVAPGAPFTTSWVGASMNQVKLSCYKGTSSPECAKIKNVDFWAAATFSLTEAVGVTLDGVRFPKNEIAGPSPTAPLDLSNATIKNITLNNLRNVRLGGAAVGINLLNEFSGVDARTNGGPSPSSGGSAGSVTNITISGSDEFFVLNSNLRGAALTINGPTKLDPSDSVVPAFNLSYSDLTQATLTLTGPAQYLQDLCLNEAVLANPLATGTAPNTGVHTVDFTEATIPSIVGSGVYETSFERATINNTSPQQVSQNNTFGLSTFYGANLLGKTPGQTWVNNQYVQMPGPVVRYFVVDPINVPFLAPDTTTQQPVDFFDQTWGSPCDDDRPAADPSPSPSPSAS